MKAIIVSSEYGILPSKTGQFWFANESRVVCEAYETASVEGFPDFVPTNRAWTDSLETIPLSVHKNDVKFFQEEEPEVNAMGLSEGSWMDY